MFKEVMCARNFIVSELLMIPKNLYVGISNREKKGWEIDTMEKERKKVLIADGSTFMRIMLAMALEKSDFEVVGEAKNGREAIDKYMELKSDVMLVDVALEEKDGIEVTRAVVNENPSVVVIMLISESVNSPKVIVEAVRAGAVGYIKKPLTAEEIKMSIKDALKRR